MGGEVNQIAVVTHEGRAFERRQAFVPVGDLGVQPTDKVLTPLNPNWSDTSVTLPAEVTLTVTDNHPAGPLIPGAWSTFEITATGGENVQTVEVQLLVGGVKVYLPLVNR